MLNNMQVSAGTGEWFAGMSRDRGMVCRYEQGQRNDIRVQAGTGKWYAGMSRHKQRAHAKCQILVEHTIEKALN